MSQKIEISNDFKQSHGILHLYAPGLVAFEHIPHYPTTNHDSGIGIYASQHNERTKKKTPRINKLFFVAGLGDGLSTVPFIRWIISDIALATVDEGGAEMGKQEEEWHVVEVLTSSSYKGWGTGSVKRDAEEISKCIKYFREYSEKMDICNAGDEVEAWGGDGKKVKSKFVLMGHSTGSQDTLQYLMNSAENRAPVLEGAILQAPVSDREAIIKDTSKTAYLTSLNFAESWIKDCRGGEIVPSEMRPTHEDVPVCAERWFSLAASLDAITGKPQGSEDFFSSDIPDESLAATFGKIPPSTKLLILFSGNDEFVPPSVDKEALVNKWKDVCEKNGITVAEESGVIPGAGHSVDGASDEVSKDFLGRVRRFLKHL